MASSQASRGGASAAGHLIAAALVAKCAGVDPENRRKWASGDEPLLRAGPRFTEYDAIETAIFDSMRRANQKLARPAWLSIRAEVRTVVFAGTDDLWVLVSATGLGHSVVAGAEAAAELAAASGEAYHVISVRHRIASARRLFRQETARLRDRTKARAAANRQGT